MNNKYIKDESQRKRFLEEERKKRNRFLGLVLILVMLLFILPTYNLAQSYQSLQDKKEQYKQLEKEYKETSEQKEYQQDIAKKLKDDDYATKYARILFQKMVNMFIPSQIYSPNNRWKISYKQLNNFLNFRMKN